MSSCACLICSNATPELLGRDLPHRRRRALPELGDAVEQRDRVVGVDLEPRVDLRRTRRAGNGARVGRVERGRVVEGLRLGGYTGDAEADHEARAALQERAPRDLLFGEDLRDPVLLCPIGHLLRPLRHHCRGLLDRGEDARIGATTAQVTVHRGPDLRLGRALRGRQADRRPGSSFRSDSNRSAEPERRSTPAAADATQRVSAAVVPRELAHRAGMPSSVVIALPLTAATGVTHERISLPSSNTEQAPHCARPQPKRGPCRWSSLCRTYSNGVSRLAVTLCTRPLTLILSLLATYSSILSETCGG